MAIATFSSYKYISLTIPTSSTAVDQRRLRPPRYKSWTHALHAARSQSPEPASHASPSGNASMHGSLGTTPSIHIRRTASSISLDGASDRNLAYDET